MNTLAKMAWPDTRSQECQVWSSNYIHSIPEVWTPLCWPVQAEDIHTPNTGHRLHHFFFPKAGCFQVNRGHSKHHHFPNSFIDGGIKKLRKHTSLYIYSSLNVLFKLQKGFFPLTHYALQWCKTNVHALSFRISRFNILILWLGKSQMINKISHKQQQMILSFCSINNKLTR